MSDIKQHWDETKDKLKHEAKEETQQFLAKQVSVKVLLIVAALTFVLGVYVGW